MNKQIKPVEVLDWLYRMQKKTRIDLGRAEGRENTRPEELVNLMKKLAYIDYLIGKTIEDL